MRFMVGGVFTALTSVHAQAPRSADTLGASWEYDSQLVRYRVEVVATGVRVPFGMAFLPDASEPQLRRSVAPCTRRDFSQRMR